MSPSRHDIETLLDEAGRRESPLPSPEFVSRLEARILGDAVPTTAMLVTPLERSPRTRFLKPAVFAAAAAIAAVVVVSALAGWFGTDSTQRRLQLASARDTTVVLPDGDEVQGRSGLDLPDGTVVTTGPEGHAAVGPVDLGPSTTAIVEDGRLKITVPDVTLPPVTTPTLPGL